MNNSFKFGKLYIKASVADWLWRQHEATVQDLAVQRARQKEEAESRYQEIVARRIREESEDDAVVRGIQVHLEMERRLEIERQEYNRLQKSSIERYYRTGDIKHHYGF